MDLTLVLIAACAVLFLALLVLTWLHWRPRVRFSVELPRGAPIQPRPTHAKCNMRHFIYESTDPETHEVRQRDVFRHPYCQGADLALLTNAHATAEHPDWKLIETRDEVHWVKL